LKRLCAAVLAAFAAQAAGQSNTQKSDWELEQERRGWQEREVVLPAQPKGELVEFFVTAASNFKFFVDAASLSVADDGVVRYTLVARSPSGASNISYEGIRCERPASYRVYAYGNEGAWSKNTRSDWRPIQDGQIQRWHYELSRFYFCPQGGRIHSPAEGVDALRRGGHPSITNSDRVR